MHTADCLITRASGRVFATLELPNGSSLVEWGVSQEGAVTRLYNTLMRKAARSVGARGWDEIPPDQPIDQGTT